MTRLLMAGQLAGYRGADGHDGRFPCSISTTQPAASIRSSQARRSNWSHAAAPSKVRTRSRTPGSG
jgi:hypothetical protein